VRAVFTSLHEYLRADVLQRVMSQLPCELQDLWTIPDVPEWIQPVWGLP
jgi:uncharacterized protein (DUF2267 family)